MPGKPVFNYLSAERIALVIGASFLLAYFAWTASSSGSLFSIGATSPWPFSWGERVSYYGLLAEGLLDGSLHLSLAPSPELLALPNPYDPVANAPYRLQPVGLHDASLYGGLYYLQWGPTPAVLIYAPLQAVGIYPPDVLVAVLLAFLGSCFAIATLRFLVQRFVPDTPVWLSWLGYLALVTGSALPFVLRRIDVYEISLFAAYCFAWAGILLLLKGILVKPYRLSFLLLASLSFGLALGSRQTMVLLAVPLLAAAIFLVTREGQTSRRVLIVTGAILGPFALMGLLLALYNYFRFDSVLEFGSSYQLAGVDVTQRTSGSLSYVLPGVWYYLFAKAELTAVFPFIQLPLPPTSYPFNLPAGYDGLEKVVGVFPAVPITLLAFASVLLLRTRLRVLGLVSGSLLLLALAFVLLTSFALWGATMRYEVDFATLFIVSALLVWISLLALAKDRVARVSVAAVGSAALLWGVVFGLASGLTGYYGSLQASQPGTWRALETTTNPLAVFVARLQGSEPQVVAVSPPESIVVAPNPASPTTPISIRVSNSPAVVELISGRSGIAAVGVSTVLNEQTAKQASRTLMTIRSPKTQSEWTGPAARLRIAGATIDLKAGRNTLFLESPDASLVLEELSFGPVRD